MKTKLFVFAICNLLLINMLFSQSINGKLGLNGEFIIRDTANTFLTLNQSTGYLFLNRGLTLPYTNGSNEGIIYFDNFRFLHLYGNDNMFVGINSGNFTVTGGSNEGLGLYTLNANTGGYLNLAVGAATLMHNTSGFQNTGLGSVSLWTNTIGSFNTAVGYGTLYSNTIGNNNTAIGSNSLYSNTTGIQNTAIGDGSMYGNTTGSNNIAIGYGTNVPSFTASNQVRIGNNLITYAGIQVAWTITSDRRWKSDIKSSPLGLSFINKLNPVSYFRTNDEKQKTEYGFIAQEVEGVLNESGAENSGMISVDDAGKYEMRYNDLLAPMVKAIQELNTENDELKNKNKNLEQRLTKYEQMQNMLASEIEKLKSNNSTIKEVKLGEK